MTHLTQVFSDTLRDSKNHEDSSTAKEQEARLTDSPSKVLNYSQTAQVCRNFNNTKDELCEVDAQAKTANIQAQSIE